MGREAPAEEGYGQRRPRVPLGLGRTIALHYCSSTSHHIHEHIRYLYI
jgi:hypothetical protein